MKQKDEIEMFDPSTDAAIHFRQMVKQDIEAMRDFNGLFRGYIDPSFDENEGNDELELYNDIYLNGENYNGTT